VRRVTGVAYAIVMEGIEPVEEAQVVAWLHSSPMRVFRQLARAVAHAHTLQIAHRDIKPSNLVFSTRIDNTPRVVLIDWGHACDSRRALCTRKVEVTKAGTLAYRAPEVLVDSKRVSADLDNSSILFAQDIWSLGCLFLDLLFVGGHAHQYEADARFSCRTSQELLLWWTAYQAELDRSARSCLVESDSMMLPSMLHLVLTHMLVMDPCKRASASEIESLLDTIESALLQDDGHDVSAVLLSARRAGVATPAASRGYPSDVAAAAGTTASRSSASASAPSSCTMVTTAGASAKRSTATATGTASATASDQSPRQAIRTASVSSPS
jgi:serine/threonine protein kinase